MQSRDPHMIAIDNHAMFAETFGDSGYMGRVAPARMKPRISTILLSTIGVVSTATLGLLSIVRRRLPDIAVIAISVVFWEFNLPPGIPADVLFAKGASRLAHLIRRLS